MVFKFGGHNAMNKAFSMIEVCLAVAVVSIGCLALLGLFSQGLYSSRGAMDQTTAGLIVSDVLTVCRVAGCSSTSIWYDIEGMETATGGYFNVHVAKYDEGNVIRVLVSEIHGGITNDYWTWIPKS